VTAGRPAESPALGVDIGGVVIDRVGEGTDTSFFGDRPLDTPAVPGAFETLARLTVLFDGRVHLVSKAGPEVEARTRDWLAHHRFFEATGLPERNLHVVRGRADKAPEAARLGLTHFVDDRVDILQSLVTVPHRYLFLGGLGSTPRPSIVPPDLVVTESWPEIATAVGSTLRGPT
jgi:hypothetical protein